MYLGEYPGIVVGQQVLDRADGLLRPLVPGQPLQVLDLRLAVHPVKALGFLGVLQRVPLC